MQTRRIGQLDVSIVGLGCNNFGRRLDADATLTVVNAALEAGVNFFDTADVYGTGQSEEYLGRALGTHRKDALIATKFGNNMQGQYGAKPDYIRTAVEASLKRLNTDYIDLYQLHLPDVETPIADTLGALNELVQAGKVREIGCSNFTAPMLREAEAAASEGKTARFVSVQNYYSMFHREPEAEVLPLCEQLGLGFLPYFPLENGILTGKYRLGQPKPENTRLSNTDRVTDDKLVLVEKLISFAESHGHTILDLAFSWLLAHPATSSVIAGATKAEQVQANAAAANWQLSSADLAEIDTLLP
jgi:aryl-alcohol dehydrogenase-like predicted oxidoreductase